MPLFIKLFIRTVKREKLFSFINILGLSLGIACSLLIYFYVKDEVSHDKFHANSENIYRINQTFIWGDNTRQLFSSTGPGVSLAIGEEIPEVTDITRVHTVGSYLLTVKTGDQIISNQEENLFSVDQNFLEVFTFPLISGDKKTVLEKPNSIVLTESAAAKYFGNQDAMGQQILLGKSGNQVNYEVTGILEDIPGNSYISFDMLLSMSSFQNVENMGWSWIWTTFETYVVLDPKADPRLVKDKIAALPPRHAEATLQRVMGMSFEDYIRSGKEWNLYMQPFTDIHLGSTMIFNRLNNVGNQTVVNVLSVAVFFILLLSAINYINLKTSLITRNAKDTGIRKLMGSNSLKVTLKFFTESFLFVLVSILFGVLIAYFTVPYFNLLTGKEITQGSLITFPMINNLGILLIGMSLICGIYPSILLSAFSPLDVVRGKLKSGKDTQWIRNGMVIFQFSISIILIASTLLVYRQVNFSYNRDIGFDKEQLLTIERVEWIDNKESFAEELASIANIESISFTSSVPPNIFNGDQFMPEDNQNLSVPLNFSQSDHNYISTLGIELLHGRNFTELGEQEKNKVILNQAALEVLNWEENDDVIGKKLIYPGKEEPFEVIGVVKDFNYWSLQSSIEPMAIFHISEPFYNSYGSLFYVARVNSQDVQGTLEAIKDKWEASELPVGFNYQFVDDAFNQTFQSTERFGNTMVVFATLAILIAALGLLGMIVYVVDQRLKEIGIRKVLGSSPNQLIMLMSRKFVFLILLALFISIPLTYYLMDFWLASFEYKTNISASIFMISGLFTVILAVVIVGSQTLRASSMNPATILRDE